MGAISKKQLLKNCVISHTIGSLFAFFLVYLFIHDFFAKYVLYSLTAVLLTFLVTLVTPSPVPIQIERTLLYPTSIRWGIEILPVALTFFALWAMLQDVNVPLYFSSPGILA